MAENKTKPTAVAVKDYIAAIEDEGKREDAKVLVKMLGKVTGEKPKLWGPSIIGFGSYHYKYESGHEGDAPIIAFSPRKAAHSLYGFIGTAGAEDLLAKLGKHKTGKGCLYVNKLANVDLQVLEQLAVNAYAAHKAK